MALFFIVYILLLTNFTLENSITYFIKHNDTTEAAIEEGRKLLNNPNAPRYSSMDELKAALEV